MDDVVRAITQGVPQFFGDERHERMQHDQNLVEHPARDDHGFSIHLALFTVNKSRLDKFEIPIAELVKDHVINHISHAVEAEFGEGLVQLFDGANHLADNPTVNRELGFGGVDAVRSADAV